MQDAFSFRRLQALARLAAYVLLVEFLLNTLLSALPLSLQPSRWLGLISGLLDTASLPLLGIILFYGGMASVVRVSRWEWTLARLFRPLLALAAILFLGLVPAVWAIGGAIHADGDSALRQQGQQTMAQVAQFRRQLSAAPDSASLRRLVEAQPLLRQSLTTSDSPFRDASFSFAEQRRRAGVLVDRLSVNISAANQRQRSDAAGDLRKQQLRLSAMALLHSLFFLVAWLIWPSGLSPRPLQDLLEPPADLHAD